MLYLKSVLKSSDNLPRNGKTITKSFFSAVNVTGFSVSLLLRRFLIQLSINLIGNAFFFNIRFTCEKEHNNSMLFLDVLITRTSNGFKTSVYHKPKFSVVYSNFKSFISEEYKVGLILTLLFRTFSIVSDVSRFHPEVCRFKEILMHFLSN